MQPNFGYVLVGAVSKRGKRRCRKHRGKHREYSTSPTDGGTMTLQVALAGPSFMLPLFSKLMNAADNTEDTDVYFENLSLDYKTDVWRKRWEMKYASPAPREDGKGFAAAAPCARARAEGGVKRRRPCHPLLPRARLWREASSSRAAPLAAACAGAG